MFPETARTGHSRKGAKHRYQFFTNLFDFLRFNFLAIVVFQRQVDLVFFHAAEGLGRRILTMASFLKGIFLRLSIFRCSCWMPYAWRVDPVAANPFQLAVIEPADSAKGRMAGQLFQRSLQRREVPLSDAAIRFVQVAPKLEIEVANEKLGAEQSEGHSLTAPARFPDGPIRDGPHFLMRVRGVRTAHGVQQHGGQFWAVVFRVEDFVTLHFHQLVAVDKHHRRTGINFVHELS